MKKLMVLLMVFAMFVVNSACMAEGQDYSTMDDATLHEIIDSVRNELTKREMTLAENTVLFETEGVTLYLTGDYEVWGSDNYYLDLTAVVVNDSDKTIYVAVDSAYINGWEAYGSGITDTAAGKKQKGTLEFLLSDADISTYEEVEDIEINFRLVDTESYDTIAELEPVTIHIKG